MAHESKEKKWARKNGMGLQKTVGIFVLRRMLLWGGMIQGHIEALLHINNSKLKKDRKNQTFCLYDE
jgi:hypothetical protein